MPSTPHPGSRTTRPAAGVGPGTRGAARRVAGPGPPARQIERPGDPPRADAGARAERDENASGSPAGSPVVLTSAVSDPDPGETYTYSWQVTDPTDPAYTMPADATTGEPTFRFTPAKAGVFLVHLTVSGSQGGTGTASFTVTAGDAGPAVLIQGAPGLATVGAAVSLSSTVSEVSGADPTTYAWSVADDGVPVTLPAGTVTNGPAFSFIPAARPAVTPSRSP